MTGTWPTKRLDSRRSQHRGMTMIELLIVVAVMVILMGIALPLMKTGIEGRKLREAARQVNTGSTLAKALSAETGRFAALVIDVESLPEDATKLFARRLYLAETPPPYAGDVVGATSTIRYGGGASAYADFDASSSNLKNVAKVGDLIRLDYRNPYYSITNITPGVLPVICTIEFTGPSLPPTGVALPYEIIRSPEKSGATPLELPSGAVIDLNNSGFGLTDLSLSRAFPPAWTVSTPYPRCVYCQPTTPNGFCYFAVVPGISGTSEPVWPTTLGAMVLDGTTPNIVRWQCVAPRPVTVVFGSSGRMMGVTGLTPPLLNKPVETLHLLIGDLEHIGALNLANHSTLWVSIAHHAGRITTTENAGLPPVWKSSTPYSSGNYCQPSSQNGLCYIATNPGISGMPEPAWPISQGATVADGGLVWECRSPAPWSSSTAYLRGTYCRPTTPNGFCYVVRVAGVSGGTSPTTWPIKLGDTIVDGGVLWECTLLMEPIREFAQSAQAMGGL